MTKAKCMNAAKQTWLTINILAKKQAYKHVLSPIAEINYRNMDKTYVTSNKMWPKLCDKNKYIDSQYSLTDNKIVPKNQMAKTTYVITANIS